MNHIVRKYSALALTLWCALSGIGCGSSNAKPEATSDAGLDAQGLDADGLPTDFFPAPAAVFTGASNAPATVQISISGEDLAQVGYSYSASPADGEPVFVDGWEVRFDHYLIVVDTVRLNQAGSDPSRRDSIGAEVAQARGPWLVDLHSRGPLVGVGGAPETSHPLVVFDKQTSGDGFDTNTTYAFSYRIGRAQPGLRNVSLVEDDRGLAVTMVQKGLSHYISGTASYKGRTPTDSVDVSFKSYPTQVSFSFGFRAEADYINCHNPEIGEADVPANRGIRPSASGARRAQITFHTDHLFWSQLEVEGTPLHFDPFAARSSGFGADGGTAVVMMDDLAGVVPVALVDRSSMPVRDRGAQTAGYVPSGAPPAYRVNSAQGVTDLREFVAYSSRAGGHLNSDGLCFVRPVDALAF